MPDQTHKPGRIVEPELLDALPASDPAAVRSRRDLQLVNTLMGNKRWILKQVRALPEAGWQNGWELGAGDGDLGAAIAACPDCPAAELTALDLAPRTPHWPEGWDWIRDDLLEVADSHPEADLVVANLILHHFQDEELTRLGRWLCNATTVIAVEPLRARLPHALAYAMRLLGINFVTREDIHTSIRAGFCGQELPQRLGLTAPDWQVSVSTTALGAYRMIATRAPQP